MHLLFCLSSLLSPPGLFLYVISSCWLMPVLHVWVSGSCRMFCLLVIRVCFNIHGVKKMCTQAGDPLLMCQMDILQWEYTNKRDRMLLFAFAAVRSLKRTLYIFNLLFHFHVKYLHLFIVLFTLKIKYGWQVVRGLVGLGSLCSCRKLGSVPFTFSF